MVSARPVDSPSSNSASYLPPHDGVDCITKITGPGVTAGIGETGEEWSRNTSIGRDGAILFFLEQIEWLSTKGSSLTLVGVWQTTSHNHVTGLHSSEAHYRLPLDENQAPASHHVASVAAKSFSRPHGNGREDEGEGPPSPPKGKGPKAQTQHHLAAWSRALPTSSAILDSLKSPHFYRSPIAKPNPYLRFGLRPAAPGNLIPAVAVVVACSSRFHLVAGVALSFPPFVSVACRQSSHPTSPLPIHRPSQPPRSQNIPLAWRIDGCPSLYV